MQHWILSLALHENTVSNAVQSEPPSCNGIGLASKRGVVVDHDYNGIVAMRHNHRRHLAGVWWLLDAKDNNQERGGDDPSVEDGRPLRLR